MTRRSLWRPGCWSLHNHGREVKQAGWEVIFCGFAHADHRPDLAWVRVIRLKLSIELLLVNNRYPSCQGKGEDFVSADLRGNCP
jgi:hypothetical protein